MQTKDLVGDGIEEQTEQVMKNIGAILEAAGTSFDKVLKATVLIMDMGDFAKVNAVYGEPLQHPGTLLQASAWPFFGKPRLEQCLRLHTCQLCCELSYGVLMVAGKYFPKDPPARLCYAVKTLPVGAKVEIECIAAL